MPRLPEGQLSKHPTKGYRVSVGTYMKDGKPTEKVFWLGKNPDQARWAAHSYRTGYGQMQAMGIEHWTEELIARAKHTIAFGTNAVQVMFKMHEEQAQKLEIVRGIGFPTVTTETPATNAAAPAERPTLYAAIAKYLETIKGKRRSDSHKERADRVLNVNLKGARQDIALDQIDYLWIDQLCDYWKSRPPKINGEQISPNTVALILRYARAFFVWVDDTSYGGWTGPRKLTKPFRCNIQDLMTPAELRQSGTIRQFDTATLKTLYGKASDFQRAIMLTALFTGATQQELAVLEQSEFDLDAATLHHFRNKTRIEGWFWLPSELMELLKKAFAKRRSDSLAFRTSDGNALVTYTDGRQTSDAVRQTWDDLREAAGVPNALSFKYLRKYLADWMTRNGGEAMGQIALSHCRNTVLAKNYTTARDFETFNALQQKMHAELSAAKVFELPAKSEEMKSAKKKAA